MSNGKDQMGVNSFTVILGNSNDWKDDDSSYSATEATAAAAAAADDDDLELC